MSAPPFVLFGAAHLAALAGIAAAGFALRRVVRRAGETGRRRVCLTLAGGLAMGIAAEPTVGAIQGWLDAELLPFHMCDVAVYLAIWTLATRDRRTVAPLYFYALSGTLPALLTPEIAAGFPSFRYFIFFLPHGLVVLSVLVLVEGLRVVPRPGAWWSTFLLLNVHAALVGLVNWRLGTNFLYLARKPSGPSPFDWFGPWPYYILTLEALFLGTFRALEQPLRRLRRDERDEPAVFRVSGGML